MKKYFFLIFFTFNFVFANCYMGQWTDEMTDELNYIIRCEELDNDIGVAIFPRKKTLEVQEDKLHVAIGLFNGEKFKVKSMDGSQGLQTIEIRIDKNEYFLSEGWINDGGNVISLHFDRQQQKQIINGNTLMVRYTTTNNRLNTQKIDISGFKKFK